MFTTRTTDRAADIMTSVAVKWVSFLARDGV